MSLNDPHGNSPFGLASYVKTQTIRRKCFISYHHADESEVATFIRTFDHVTNMFISRGLGAAMSGDIINSNNSDYIMSKIRQDFLANSTVTLVIIGNCTWARRYVDWELQASLRSGEKTIPNGVLGIKLPSFSSGQYPDRLNANLLPPNLGLLSPPDCYARIIDYPQNQVQLVSAIEDAFNARNSRSKYIINSRERYSYDKNCGHPWH
jgi:hypothetical protein